MGGELADNTTSGRYSSRGWRQAVRNIKYLRIFANGELKTKIAHLMFSIRDPLMLKK